MVCPHGKLLNFELRCHTDLNAPLWWDHTLPWVTCGGNMWSSKENPWLMKNIKFIWKIVANFGDFYFVRSWTRLFWCSSVSEGRARWVDPVVTTEESGNGRMVGWGHDAQNKNVVYAIYSIFSMQNFSFITGFLKWKETHKTCTLLTYPCEK